MCCYFFFFFNDTATTEIYTLSLHDALPIYRARLRLPRRLHLGATGEGAAGRRGAPRRDRARRRALPERARPVVSRDLLRDAMDRRYPAPEGMADLKPTPVPEASARECSVRGVMSTTAVLAPRSGPSGACGRGRRDPFPPAGDGPRGPRWSPAATGQRTRAAWSRDPCRTRPAAPAPRAVERLS